MKNKIFIICLVLSCVFKVACNFNKSGSIDLMTGLTTKGDGLSVEDIYISDGENKLETTTFEYGQKIFLNFDAIEGFQKENDAVFPGMEFTVLNKVGDTVMHYQDLYANQTAGFTLSPLALMSNLTAANPITTNAEYKLINKIWDKKGNGTFKAAMDFTVIPNAEIVINNEGLNAKVIYLYSEQTKTVITDEVISFDEKIRFVIEDLDGYKQENGKASIQMSMKVTDANGTIILENDKLLNEEYVDVNLIKQSLSASLIVNKGQLKNPVTCNISISDNTSTSKMDISTKLEVTNN